MNVQILIAVLNALIPFTDLSGEALALKQKLDLYSRDPRELAQLNSAVASAICNDWGTFNQVAAFVLRVLTQDQKQNIPQALQHCERIAVETLPV